jgi:hypothetical protein
MGIAGFIISILSLFFGVIALIPFLGWLNWFVIPFAILGLTLSILGIIRGSGRLLGVIGAILCSVTIPIGVVRLIIGFGIL